MLFKIQIPEIQPQNFWVIRPEMKPGNQHWEWAQPVMLMWVVHGPHFEEFWPRWTFAWSYVLGHFKKFILVGGFAFTAWYLHLCPLVRTQRHLSVESPVTLKHQNWDTALSCKYVPERGFCVCVCVVRNMPCCHGVVHISCLFEGICLTCTLGNILSGHPKRKLGGKSSEIWELLLCFNIFS